MRQMDLPTGLLGTGACVMVGVIVGGYLMGTQIRDFKRADRYVEVKGLVERTVRADSASWSIGFKSSGDDFKSVYAENQRQENLVRAFLKLHKIQDVEIVSSEVGMNDRRANGEEKGPHFVSTTTLTVQSPDVDRIQSANAATGELLQQGVILSTTDVTYKFNGLNKIKPDMITEATRNARASADRFAADSGSRVGAIRSANQGVFSVTAANEAPSLNDESGYNSEQQADRSIMKKIRVVSTIDYYLVN